MKAALQKFGYRGCAATIFLATLLSAQQPKALNGTWQMDTAKSHVSDGRTAIIIIGGDDKSVSLTMKIRKGDQPEVVSQFTCKLDGKPCDFTEGSHKSAVTVWFNGPALNFSKEKGPAEDTTSMWKLSPDGQTLTVEISHYEPAGADETWVFTKGGA